MPLTDYRLEPDDTLREVRGARSTNLQLVPTAERATTRKTLAFLVVLAVASVVVVFFTRLLGSYVPLVVLVFLAFSAEASSINGKRFWWTRRDDESIGTFFSIVCGFIFFFILAAVYQPLNEVIFQKAPIILDFVLLASGICLALLLYVRNASFFIVAIAACSGLVWVCFVRLLSVASSPAVSFMGFAIVGLLLAFFLSKAMWMIYRGHLAASSSYKRKHVIGELSQHVGVLALGILVLFGAFLFYFFAGNIVNQMKAGICLALVSGVVFALCWFLGGIQNADQIRKAFHTIAQALTLWLSYRPHHSAAGVYRPTSPWDRLWLRRAMFIALVIAFSAAILPAACYFPVTIVKGQPWVDAGQGSFQKTVSQITGGMEPSLVEPAAPIRTQEEVISLLNSFPEAWSLVALEGLSGVNFFFFLSFFLAALISIIVPMCFALGAIATFAVPFLVPELLEQEEHAGEETNKVAPRTWDDLISTIQTSHDETEKNSLLIGFHNKAGYPIILPRESLREHVHILGDTGSGKTALGFAPLLTQLIRMAGRDKLEAQRPQENGRPVQQSSIVIIDLKGDTALFNGARHEAKQAGLAFRFFSNQNNHATNIFNPFLQTHLPFVPGKGTKLGRAQWVEKLTECLDLYHGEGYGRGHFGELNKKIINGLLDAFPEIRSFAELARYGRPDKRKLTGKELGMSPAELQQGASAFATIERVAKILPLNAIPADKRITREAFKYRINMPSVFERPMVIYFFLRSALEPANASSIGKLAMHSLLSAASCKSQAEIENKQVYLLVDEFQQVASESLSIVLQQARSMNISTVLAHQTLSDLKKTEFDLTPVVQANTRYKHFFAATDLQFQESIVKGAGKTIDASMHLFQDNFFLTPGYSEDLMGELVLEDRITPNEITRVTDDPLLSIIQLPRGAGYAQFGGFPFVSRGAFHISKDEYEQRLRQPWPIDVSGTIVTDDVNQIELDESEPGTKEKTPEQEPSKAKKKASSTEDILNDLDSRAKQRRQNRTKK